MSGTKQASKPEPVSVTVAPGRFIYTRGHSAPFRPGESFLTDPATQADLLREKHIVSPAAAEPVAEATPAAEAAPAVEQGAEHAPAPPPSPVAEHAG